MTDATIWWSGHGWNFTAGPTSTGPFDTIDRAIRAAHAAGHDIGGFQVTRGQLPEVTTTEKGSAQ